MVSNAMKYRFLIFLIFLFVRAHEQFGSISWAENVSKIIYVDPKSWICQRNPFYDGVKRCWCSDLTGMCLCGREGEAACRCDIRHGSNTSLDCEPALSLWKSRERLQQRLVLSEKSRCFPRGLQCEEPAWMGRLVRRRSRPEGPDHEEAGWLSETQRDACGKDRACCYLQINNIKSGSLSCRQLQERLVHLLSVCCDLTSDLCTDGCFARAETVSSLFLANRCVWWWMVTDFKDCGSVISLVSIRRDSSEVWARFVTLKLKTIKDGRSHCDTFWSLSVHSEMSS